MLQAIKANQLDEFVVLLNLSLYKQSAYGLRWGPFQIFLFTHDGWSLHYKPLVYHHIYPRFDRADWMNFMSSLKPLGLAILLNNSCSMGSSVTSHLNHISVDKKYGFKLPLPTGTPSTALYKLVQASNII